MSTDRARPEDSQGIKITREIPLWQLLAALGAFIYAQGQDYLQAKQQEAALQALTQEVRQASSKIAAKDIVDALQDAQIRGHDAQIRELQSKVQR